MKAFPCRSIELEENRAGMDLRDYFAAKAMQGLLANAHMGDSALHDSAEEWLSDITGTAYEMADAMMKARD